MKIKTIWLVVVIVLIVLIQGLRVWGLQPPPIRIDRANLSKNYSFLVVKTEYLTNTEMFSYTILVLPIKGHNPADFFGTLEVGDGTNRLMFAPVGPVMGSKAVGDNPPFEGVPKSLKTKSIAYRFQVSVKYLSMSHFQLVEYLGDFDTSPTSYSFTLGDFILK